METPDGLNPMSEAPKDRPILVVHVHEADPYYEDPDGKNLSPYGCHVETFTHMEDGPYVAVWGGEDHEYDDLGRLYQWPDWWFVNDGDWESPLSPVGWLPIPGFTKPKDSTCVACGASGFPQSFRKANRCDFCDNPEAD